MNLKKYLTYSYVGKILLGYAGISWLLANLGILRNLSDNWQMQLLGVAAVGGVCLYFAKNPDKAPFKMPGDGYVAPVKLADIKVAVAMTPDGISKIELADLSAVDHLTDRFLVVGDVEGVKLCKDIQVKLFDIHHKAAVEAVSEVKV